MISNPVNLLQNKIKMPILQMVKSSTYEILLLTSYVTYECNIMF